MSAQNGKIERLSPMDRLKPSLTLIIAPLGLILEFIIEAPFMILMFIDRLFKGKPK